MRSLVLRIVLAALSLLPFAAGATYVFNTVEYPGAVFTDVRGINNTGRIVGYASFDGVNYFSFTYQGGVFSGLPAVPGGPGIEAVAHGINDAGDVVGTLVDTTGVAGSNGFILPHGSFSYMGFARPAWFDTLARAISNSGLVVGYNDDGTGSTAGFIFDPSTFLFTDITIPGSLLTIAQSMNGAGQVVGSAVLPLASGGTQAWLREPGGAITLFQIAGRPTRARGINDVGLIAGFTSVGAVNMGFVANSSGFEDLMVPGSDSTFGESINNAGQVAGLFWTGGASMVTHGFIATPAAMPTGTTSSGAYTFTVDVVPGVPIFIDPPVAVGYDYSIGKDNPRIAAVRLPIGIGDNMYRVKAQGRKFILAAGDLLDFTANGFPNGVSDFTVSCIEVEAMVDPNNPQAFPTQLTFMSAGTFTGTMKPLVKKAGSADKKKCLAES